VTQQDADFIIADFLYMFRASCAHHHECKIRDETKRNETKRNETKRNETKRNETKRRWDGESNIALKVK